MCPQRGVCLAEAEAAVQRGVAPAAEDVTAAWPWQRIWRPGTPGDSERAAAATAAALTTRRYHTCRRTLEQILAYAERNSEERFLLASASTAADSETSTRRAPAAPEGSKDEDASGSLDDPEPSKSAFELSPTEDETPTAAEPGGTAPLELEPTPPDFSRPPWEESPAAGAPETKPSQEAPRPLPARRNPRVSDTTTRSGRQRRRRRVSFWTRALGFCGRGCVLLLLRLFASRRQWTLTRTAIIVGSILPGPQQPLALAFFQPLAFGYAASPTLRKLRPGLWRSLEFWQRVIPVYIAYKLTAKKANKLSAADARLLWEERHAWGSERVYRLCMELRGFFLKDGRLLSQREDFLPSAWCSRLGMLEDCVPPVPIDEIRATVQEAFGIPMESLFLWFDRLALATATIAQVHRCEMPDGRSVVLKAQYGSQEKLCQLDLKNLRLLARFLQAFELQFDLVSVVREFERQIPLEFDFEREARMMNTIRRNIRSAKLHDFIVVPEIVNDLVARRALVMTYIAGCKITDVERIADWELDMPNLMENVVIAYGQMMLVDGVFHADPHPGNLLAMQDGRVALIDFGQVKRLREFTRRRLCWLYLALADGDDHLIATRFQELGVKINMHPALRSSVVPTVLESRPNASNSARSHTEIEAVSDAGTGRDSAGRWSEARPSSSRLASLMCAPTDTTMAMYARYIFDNRPGMDVEVSSPDGATPLKFLRFQEFPEDLYLVVHCVQLLRGLLERMNANVSLSEAFAPYAAKGIRKIPHMSGGHVAALSHERPRSQGRMPPTPAVQSPRTRSSGSMSSESSNVQPPGRASPGLHPADRPSRTHASRSVLPSERSVSAPNSPMNDASSRWALTAPSESPLKQPRQL